MRIGSAREPDSRNHATIDAIVDADARPYQLQFIVASLGHDLGIRNRGASDADEVSVAVGQNTLGRRKVEDASDEKDREVGRLLDAAAQLDPFGVSVTELALCAGVVANIEADIVDGPGGPERIDRSMKVIKRVRTFNDGIEPQTKANRDRPIGGGTDVVDDFAGSSVVAVQFDCVGTCLYRQRRSRTVFTNQLVEFNFYCLVDTYLFVIV